MKLFTITILTMILTAMTISAQTMPPLETGVPQALAKWRATNYSNVRYKLNVTLEKGAPLMRGDVEISVDLTDEGARNGLILDWRTTQFQDDKNKPDAEVFEVNGKVSSASNDNLTAFFSGEHIVISPELLKRGENVVKIKFASPIKTSGAAITRYVDKEDGAEYIYSLFVPSDASTAFPVFDQPDLKARFTLSVEIPYQWNVISNAQPQSYPSEPQAPVEGQVKTISFQETQKISSYVFAFAVGNFDVFTEYPNETRPEKIIENKYFGSTDSARIFVRKSQAEKFKQHATEVFRLNREGVKFLENYFDYKFPFPKYDLVLIPEFPFGGMEHSGATFLREDRIIFPTEPTKNDYITRANVIFHEAAHQWFGDTVTMRWFDDLWLKEGFAEFMAYKTLEKVMPEYNAWKIFYERNKQAAYLTDATKGTTPIYQEISNLSAAKSAYGNIVYRKAPSFLKQAEFYLGEKEFQTAARQFLKKNEFANAEWTDLVKEFELAKGFEKGRLKNWADVWIKQPGVGRILTDIETIPSQIGWNGIGFDLLQLFKPNMNDYWRQKVKILIITKTGKKKIQDFPFDGVNVGGTVKGFTKTFLVVQRFRPKTVTSNFQRSQPNSDILISQESPVAVFPNYQDYGYGIFLLDEESRAYVLANIQNEKDDFLRAMMWGSLWDSVREGELNPKDYVELVVKNIRVETDESTIQTLLGRVSTAMNYYLPDKDRELLAPKIEAVLIGRMLIAKTIGQRITFFRAYLNIASTDNSQEILKKILKSNGKPVELVTLGSVVGKAPAIEIPPLKTKDKFDIVTKLLILENKRIIGNNEAEKMLSELEKMETSDEAKRYAYAAKAGIAAKENKEKFWNDFVNDKEISESWIEAAFVSFNSIRHSDLTLPYLERSLAELPNLKKNRKIFFVNGWLAAFIGGQRSEQALAIVNKFLADNPNLDKDLRLKILENSDNLERAVKIRGRFQDK